ncbi:MAG TPA: hypothetical protein VJR47_22645 [Stellaceae bacterium]|nr:hypothetical protein [Stellaceae bacterium]
MGLSLQQFAGECHRILAANPGPEGRKQVCALVEEACKDKDFIAANFGEGVGQRDILYEDPELGFCVCAHVYKDARESQPHDHGPSWAIYGQVAGETLMNDWALLEPAGEGKIGKVRFVRSYSLTPGMAHLYNEGDLHSPRRDGPTKLLRIEGRNLDKVRRFGYRAA